MEYPNDCPYFKHVISCPKCCSCRSHLCNSVYNFLTPRCTKCKYDNNNIIRCEIHQKPMNIFEKYLKYNHIVIINHSMCCFNVSCPDENSLFGHCLICDNGRCLKHDVAKMIFIKPDIDDPKEIGRLTTIKIGNFYKKSIFENIMDDFNELYYESTIDLNTIIELQKIEKILETMISSNFN